MPDIHHHGPDCGHRKIPHAGHADYLNENGLIDCPENKKNARKIPISDENPKTCQPVQNSEHVHSTGCGHQKIIHGDHTDYLVDGNLEHPHGDHNDNHGKVRQS